MTVHASRAPASRSRVDEDMVVPYLALEYFCLVRVKTSITLSRETLRALDKLSGRSNRSRVIEEAVSFYLKEQDRAARYTKELELINRHASWMNKEMEDVLRDQADIFGDEARDEAR